MGLDQESFVTISVKLEHGGNLPLVVNRWWTVGSVKCVIQDKRGVQKDMRLINPADKEMEDHETLAANNITEGCTIKMLGRLGGGGRGPYVRKSDKITKDIKKKAEMQTLNEAARFITMHAGQDKIIEKVRVDLDRLYSDKSGAVIEKACRLLSLPVLMNLQIATNATNSLDKKVKILSSAIFCKEKEHLESQAEIYGGVVESIDGTIFYIYNQEFNSDGRGKKSGFADLLVKIMGDKVDPDTKSSETSQARTPKFPNPDPWIWTSKSKSKGQDLDPQIQIQGSGFGPPNRP